MKTFITNIFNAISNNLISGGAYYLILKGVLVTFAVTVIAWIVAAGLGIAVSYLMCYEKKVMSVTGRALCFIFRSVPALLTAWLFYYCFLGNLSSGATVIFGLSIGLWGAGHFAEIISEAVRREQLRLTNGVKEKLGEVFYSTVIPQALEDSRFYLKRLAVQILQWTAVAGYVGVNDLTEVMYGIGHRTMYPFFSIAFSAILYLLATVLIEWAFSLLEKYVFKKEQ